jgi:hypothetical protein
MLSTKGESDAEIAQSEERDLAKVEATSSNLVFRSITQGAFEKCMAQPGKYSHCETLSVMDYVPIV